MSDSGGRGLGPQERQPAPPPRCPSSVRGLALTPELPPWALAPPFRDGATPTQIRPVWVTEEAAPPPVRGGGNHGGSPWGPPRSPHPHASRGTRWGSNRRSQQHLTHLPKTLTEVSGAGATRKSLPLSGARGKGNACRPVI